MELIDKNKLLSDNYCNYCPYLKTESCDKYCHTRMNDILATRIMIKNAPIVDATPVIHGNWIDDIDNDYGYFANCSECGYQIDVHKNRGYFNYCPECCTNMVK